MILIAGLGNLGKEYSLTRHNAGYILIDRLIDNLDIIEKKRKFKSKIAFADFEGKRVLLMQPLTFMNESGFAILNARKFYKDEINKILIVHDDIDLDFKAIRFKKNGGTAGHKGLISILKINPDSEFNRLRIGVGRPPCLKTAANYVLKNFNKREQKELDALMELTVEAVKDYIKYDIEFCMNKYN
jgi:peptidyl-tRNA hydrolase, PTH1 family